MEKISRFGEYSGYSEEIYTDALRSSRYIYIRGNNLAIDVYRPGMDGIPVDERFPAIFQATHYGRRMIDILSVRTWVKRGYIVAVLDPRGLGDSFGSRPYEWSREEVLDLRDVIEWLASEPYCSGKIGGWGISFMGGIQLMMASVKPLQLACIVPVVTTVDQYMRHPNGVALSMPGGAPPTTQDAAITTGVDADPNGIMARAARKEHKDNKGLRDMWPLGKPLFRNTYVEAINDMPSIAASPITYSNDIKASGIPMYNMAGWFDQAPTQQLGAWKLWGGKLMIGAWAHMMARESEVLAEHLRWYDNILKGIPNNIMDEATIHYMTINAPEGEEWRTTDQWPLANQQLTKFYFRSGPTSMANSVNDGGLSTTAPDENASGQDDYQIDYSVEFFDGKFRENARLWDGDMTPNCDSKSLTYTTPVLTEEMEITGHPVVYLWISSTSTDGYFFAVLEEVDPDTGKSHYITNGQIKASNRALHTQSPWTEMGIPYHRCYDIDSQLLTIGEPTELAFDLYPTSYLFQKGKCIRVTITGSMQQLYPGMKEDPAPTITIYHSCTNASYIELPVIPIKNR